MKSVGRGRAELESETKTILIQFQEEVSTFPLNITQLFILLTSQV